VNKRADSKTHIKQNVYLLWKFTKPISQQAPFPFILSGATAFGSEDEGGKGGG
jgi:hypothetical protein